MLKKTLDICGMLNKLWLTSEDRTAMAARLLHPGSSSSFHTIPSTMTVERNIMDTTGFWEQDMIKYFSV